MDKKPLIVVFNVKKYLKAKGYRTNSQIFPELERIVTKALDKAVVQAHLENRSTVMGRYLSDIEV